MKVAQEHQKGKTCTKCKKHKPYSKFHKSKATKDGLRPVCKFCKKEYADNTCRFKRWWDSKKSHAKERGIVFTIEPTDIPGVKIRKYYSRNGRLTWNVTEYPKVCSKRGTKLDWKMNGLQWNSPSLDRMDPTKGYIPGNVILVCNSYNSAKSNCPLDIWEIEEKRQARFVLFGG